MPQLSSHPKSNLKRQTMLIGLVLVFITFLVYMPASNCGFVNFDDNRFVTKNTHLQDGLTKEAFSWAMSAGWPGVESTADYWRPISFLSHALDIELFGLEARGHHLMSVGIHAAAAVALFLALQVLTGSVWRSAFVAALFALHPLRVESVAWIAERKDVLSGFFFFVSIGMYALYARRRFSFGRYLSLVAVFLLAVMSKPMMVTLPGVLILLDFWPLKRLGISAPGKRFKWWTSRVVLEKIPLFLLSAVLSLGTLFNQNEIGAVSGENELSWSVRAANAVVSYVVYLVQTVFPAKLVVLYPYTKLEPWKVVGAAVILIGLTTFVILRIRRSPYLATGWFWYLGMLFPVCGLAVQVGGQAHADRYAYIPTVGLYIMAAWMASDFFERWRHKRLILGAAAASLLIPLGVMAQRQLSHWKDSRALWEHAIRHTAGNSVAHAGLGSALYEEGQFKKAIFHFEQSLDINPYRAKSHNNLATVLGGLGQFEKAAIHLERALELNPDSKFYFNLAWVYAALGQPEKAIPHFEKALEVNPNDVQAHDLLRTAKTALTLNQRGIELVSNGQYGEAVQCFDQVLKIYPAHSEAKKYLAWLLATCPDSEVRNGTRAVELARTVVQRFADDASAWEILAAAYAEADCYPDAVNAARRALELTKAQHKEITSEMLECLRLYEAGQPYRITRPADNLH